MTTEEHEEWLKRTIENFDRNKDDILAKYQDDVDEYRMYLNGILLIIGFAITVSVYIVTRTDETHAFEGMITICILLSMLTCGYGCLYLFTDSHWKNKTKKSLRKELLVSTNVGIIENTISVMRNYYIRPLRLEYQVNKTKNAFLVCVLLFLASFFVLCVHTYFDNISIFMGKYSFSAGLIATAIISILMVSLLWMEIKHVQGAIEEINMESLVEGLRVAFPYLREKSDQEVILFALEKIYCIKISDKKLRKYETSMGKRKVYED